MHQSGALVTMQYTMQESCQQSSYIYHSRYARIVPTLQDAHMLHNCFTWNMSRHTLCHIMAWGEIAPTYCLIPPHIFVPLLDQDMYIPYVYQIYTIRIPNIYHYRAHTEDSAKHYMRRLWGTCNENTIICMYSTHGGTCMLHERRGVVVVGHYPLWLASPCPTMIPNNSKAHS